MKVAGIIVGIVVGAVLPNWLPFPYDALALILGAVLFAVSTSAAIHGTWSWS